MSTDSGDKAAMAGPLAESKALIEAGRESVEVQEDLFTVTAEDMVEARAALGVKATRHEVLQEARRRGRGRPKGARNRATDDFKRYILSHGQDPAITLIQIASAQPEMLIEASQQPKVHSFTAKGKPNMVVERMTYEQAQALRARCADILMPYIHGKKPLQVDMSFSGLSDLIIAGQTHSDDEVEDIIDADFTDADVAGDGDGE